MSSYFEPEEAENGPAEPKLDRLPPAVKQLKKKGKVILADFWD